MLVEAFLWKPPPIVDSAVPVVFVVARVLVIVKNLYDTGYEAATPQLPSPHIRFYPYQVTHSYVVAK